MSSGWSIPAEFRSTVDPATVFDVGVNTGTPALYEAFPAAYFVLVEPVRESRKSIRNILKQYRGEHVEAAAGSAAGVATINIEPNRRGKTSLLGRTELTASGDQTTPREVPVTTLDAVAADRNLRGPFGVKVDTEGYDLEVLLGARSVLAASEFVIAEVSTQKRFEGSYGAGELLALLREHGFAVFDVMGSTRAYADLLFLRFPTG